MASRSEPSPRWPALIVLALVAAGCETDTSGDTEVTSGGVPSSPGTCLVTEAVATEDLPDALQEAEGSWFGQDDLWVLLSNFAFKVDPGDGSYRVKHPWVTLDQDMGEPTLRDGAPTVGATRLDGPGVVAEAVYGNNAHTSALDFWATVIFFPATGCWEVTGTHGDTVVSFVVQVSG